MHLFGVEDEDTITAALLHDTLEDTATDYDEIAHIFGEQVASYVVPADQKPASCRKRNGSRTTKTVSPTAPEQVIIAKMADLYDNLSDRINSHKLRRTAATAERLLEVFAQGEDAHGRAAHDKLSALLEEIKSIRPLGNIGGVGEDVAAGVAT